MKTSNGHSYTQAEFAKLPPLVTRAVFLDWTGLRSQDLSAAVKSGEIKACPRAGRKKLRYFKTELARLTRMAM